MNERFDIQYGQEFAQNIQDDSGYVDLTSATVVFQYRVECGTITSLSATIVDASSGRASVTGIPVGQYQIRWKVDDKYYPDYGWDDLIVRAIDECSTFELFVSNVSRTIFPEGEAENLILPHRKYITDALIDLQQKIPCFRTQHRDRISMADTFTDCEASVVSAPRGFISQIYAVTQDNCCAKRYFNPINWDEMEQILRDNQNCGRLISPSTYYYAEYGYEEYGYFDYPAYGCLYYGDSTGGTDLRFRPTVSYSAMKDGMLYLFPWLQSNEVLVVEWDGIKRNWKDTDEVDFDREIHDAVEHFLDFRTAYREDCDIQKTQTAKALYEEIVAKLIWQCRKERRIERRVHYFSNCRDFCNASSRVTGAGGTSNIGSIGGGSITQLGDCTVNNYSELRALSTTNCQSVKVLGYASAFDGGGGIFIRLANDPPQTDNDGDIIESTFNTAYYWRKWL